MTLSKRDIRILKRLGLGIEPEEIYDARGQRPCSWKGAAKESGCEIVIADPCKKCAHQFRTRTNSCIECNPSSLIYLRRHSQNGYVYGAWSAAGGIVKIGCTTNLNKRMSVLRSKGYNGYSDWDYIFFARFENMGRTEKCVIAALKSSPSSQCEQLASQLEREAVAIQPSIAWWHFSRIRSKQGGTESWKNADLHYLRRAGGSNSSDVRRAVNEIDRLLSDSRRIV